MTVPALRQPQGTNWTVLNGELKGTIHTVAMPNLVIGRSTDCDIVLDNDPKCSRKHARVDWTEDGFIIQSLSSSSPMKVNGEPVNKSLLREQDVVCLGNTELLFSTSNDVVSLTGSRPVYIRGVTPMPERRELQENPRLELVPREEPQEPAVHPTRPPTQPGRAKSKSKLSTGRILMWGTVILGLVWLLSQEVAKHKPDPIRTSEQTDNDIKEADKLRQAAEIDRKKRMGTTNEIRQAQENYVKGFRDYKDGQYERAVESFQACLSLYPDHILCNRYLRLAQKKFDELIEAQMVLGRKYRDQGLYRECLSAFQNVRTMVKDFNSPRYREAKANFDACNAYVEGRF